MKPPLPRLHAVTDEAVARRPDLAVLAQTLARGVGAELALHARGRELSGREHFDLATRLSACPPALLFVNDRLDVALACDARGVQLGSGSLAPADARRLGPDWWVGVSVHDVAEAEAARTAGADYLVAGPVFATPTHAGRTPLAPATLAAIVALGLPVIAIGGVGPGTVAPLARAGVYGVAAIRALWEAGDPAGAAQTMRQELER